MKAKSPDCGITKRSGALSVVVGVSLALSFVGCVKHVSVPKVATTEQVWKRDCLNNAALTDLSECRGSDKHHLRCLNIAVDLKLNCEVTEVEKALPEREGKRSNK